MKNIKNSQAKVAVTNLGMYNEGSLNYEWLNVPCEREEFNAALKRIGVDGVNYEEYFISDYEGLNGISEYSSFDEINEAAKVAELVNGIANESATSKTDCGVISSAIYTVLSEMLSDNYDAEDVEDVINDLQIFAADYFKDIDGFDRPIDAYDLYFEQLQENDAELCELLESRFACYFDADAYTEQEASCDETVRYHNNDVIIRYYG